MSAKPHSPTVPRPDATPRRSAVLREANSATSPRIGSAPSLHDAARRHESGVRPTTAPRRSAPPPLPAAARRSAAPCALSAMPAMPRVAPVPRIASAPRFSSPPTPRPVAEPLDVVFEHIHGLAFLGTPREGAQSVLDIARLAVPARGGLVHLLDPARRCFFTSAAFGVRCAEMVGARIPATDSFFARLGGARKGAALTLPVMIALGMKYPERHRRFGWPDCIVGIPVYVARELTAVLEVIDPESGAGDEAFAALTYLAERFATFLEEHSARSLA